MVNFVKISTRLLGSQNMPHKILDWGVFFCIHILLSTLRCYHQVSGLLFPKNHFTSVTSRTSMLPCNQTTAICTVLYPVLLSVLYCIRYCYLYCYLYYNTVSILWGNEAIYLENSVFEITKIFKSQQFLLKNYSVDIIRRGF